MKQIKNVAPWIQELYTMSNPGLSAHFKVDFALRRVDGENDYIYYVIYNKKIYQMSLADNTENPRKHVKELGSQSFLA